MHGILDSKKKKLTSLIKFVITFVLKTNTQCGPCKGDGEDREDNESMYKCKRPTEIYSINFYVLYLTNNCLNEVKVERKKINVILCPTHSEVKSDPRNNS